MIDEEQLVEEWLIAKATGFSLETFANSRGLSYEAMRSRLTRAKKHVRTGPKPEPEIPPTHTGTTVEEKGNYLEVVCNSDRIKTIDQLVKECKIDLNEWEALVQKPNKWEVGRKHKKIDLRINAGVMDGSVFDDGTIYVEPLFQIKATFVRRHPKPLEPVVSPVSITLPKPSKPTATRTNDGLLRALILPDIQMGYRKDVYSGCLTPYHDRGALSIAWQVARQHKFDRIIALGDGLDCAELTDKFIRTPDFYWTMQPAVIEMAWWLGQFRLVAPQANMTYFKGNHELRLENMLAVHLNTVYGLKAADEIHLPPALSIPKLLGLHGLGIEYINNYPDGEVWLNDRVKVIHGSTVSNVPGGTAKAVVEKGAVSTVFGHIHRREQATRTVFDRQGSYEIVAATPGCLCHIDGRVPGNDRNQNWQQGFSIVHYRLGGFHSIETIPIIDGQAVVLGELVKAVDRTQDLRQDTSWEF